MESHWQKFTWKMLFFCFLFFVMLYKTLILILLILDVNIQIQGLKRNFELCVFFVCVYDCSYFASNDIYCLYFWHRFE